MDTQTTSRRALKPAQEQEVAEGWRWPRNEAELHRLRNNGARKQTERGHTRHAVSERQATLPCKSIRECGAETPEEREMRNGSSAIRHFERGDEDVME